MPKYYVVSGDLKFVVDAKDPESAAMKSIKKCLSNSPDTIIIPVIGVSETGFSSIDQIFPVSNIIEKLQQEMEG